MQAPRLPPLKHTTGDTDSAVLQEGNRWSGLEKNLQNGLRSSPEVAHYDKDEPKNRNVRNGGI